MTEPVIVLAAAPGFDVRRELRGYLVTCEGCGAEVRFDVGAPAAVMKHEPECRLGTPAAGRES